MMQDYELNGGDASAGTLAQPSEEAVRNILCFARCYQTIEADGVQVRFFLN